MNAEHLRERIAWECSFCARGIERFAAMSKSGTSSDLAEPMAEVAISWSEIKRLVAIATQCGWNLEHFQSEYLLPLELFRADSMVGDMLPEVNVELLREHLTRSLEHRIPQYVGWAKAELQRHLRMSPDEFEEFQLAEATPIEMELANRDIIQSLLELLVEDPRHVELESAAAMGDWILKGHGIEILGPLFRTGEVQQIREKGIQPPERWWYYLDNLRDSP